MEGHYGRGGLLRAILEALRASGKDPERLAPEDLAAVDAFHIRGREATVELAQMTAPRAGMRVLDVGCGLGGSARYLASTYGCRVVGVDLTAEYVEAAAALAGRAGMRGAVAFRRASALDLPFADGAFDLVWTEHVQMNLAGKHAFYGELARVLAPGGLLAFNDVFLGGGGAVHYPVAWAEEASISFLVTPEDARAAMEAAGFELLEWADRSRQSLEWFRRLVARREAAGPQPLGIQLLMGPTTQAKLDNHVRNLEEGRFVVAQGVARRGRAGATM